MIWWCRSRRLREFRRIRDADWNSDFLRATEIRNFIVKEIFGGCGAGDQENSDGANAAQHLSERTRWPLRFPFSGDYRSKRKPKLAPKRLPSLDFLQAIEHLFFERDRIVRTVIWIFAQQRHQQIVQRFRRSSEFRQTADSHSRFHSADRERCGAGQEETNRGAKRIHFGFKINFSAGALFGAGELRQNRGRDLRRFVAFRVQLESGETEIQKFHERPAATGRFPRNNHQIRWLNRSMGQMKKRGCAKRSHYLESGPQCRVGRHRPVFNDPFVECFALEIFRNDREVIVFNSNRERLGDINVIEFFGGLRAFF